MASFLDKFKINTAITEQTPLDLSCDHITTGNFMQLNIAWNKELVPKEKISVNMETFTRLQPMPVPTFGRARINNRAFFVPFRTVFPGWNDFITDTPHVTSNGTAQLLSTVPTISNTKLLDYFLDEPRQLVNVIPSSSSSTTIKPDFTVELSGNIGSLSSGQYKIKLTNAGRRVYNHLVSLGYKIIWTDYNTQVYSALPLLAFAKVIYDWYLPSAYMQYAYYQKADALFNKDVANYSLTSDDIDVLLAISEYVNYDSDYFVSAWDNPVNPNNSTYSAFNIIDPTNGSNSTYQREVLVSPTGSSTGSNKSPVLMGGTTVSGSALNSVSQWAIDALKSLTDYMKRHQLVGARALDRYMARFGISLSSEKLKRSVYLGMGTEDIQFGDVMSHSDTTGASLGDYAGKGIGYGGSNFDFETDEYGMMFVLSTILPKQGYVQGINRNVMHLSKLDYFTPEFDNLGTQGISCTELYVPTDTTYEFFNSSQGGLQGANDYSNSVFGWTPRYAEYKVGHDMLSGDFIYNSMNVGMDAWHTLRMLNYTSPDNVTHNREFITGADASQYNRIFQNTSINSDKFNIIYHFNIKSWSPMKSLFDTYEFEEKGKKVTVEANGVKMN